ncbi:hypothetical protein GGI03_003524 [Coemansia sp. RSA 2337]|nr:hypothetical protein H4S04_006355 [Coemansia sp. S16]KAJ2054663.1 hypothetical protein GGI08_004475 [Coemansia sp. S2]KAJ2069930.1 hypothetical protein GGH13_004342 [Coemansia sp. S155-1]KAJ2348629.1 hypothetical protein GGH92_002768 [Coemansia sp. RSA 2673]KAJ2463960.1 hypothetical protein GGI03_003524 [Coemansia sp. RSA 2337]
MSTTMSLEQRVSMLFKLLEAGSKKEYIAGKVTKLDHDLQVAHLAKNEGADEQTVLAALFLDIGHTVIQEKTLLSQYHYDPLDRLVGNTITSSPTDYGRVGAEYLRILGFPEKMTGLFNRDVMAKRYLLATDPTYQAYLNSISMESYKVEGSPLSSTEIREYEKDPLFQKMVQIRKWGAIVAYNRVKPPALDTYRDMIIKNMSK